MPKKLASLDAMRRLLAFAATRDLEDLRPERLAALRQGIAVIAAQAGHHQRRRLVITNLRAWLPQIEAALPWGSPAHRAKTVETLTDLQRTLRELLDGLFSRRGMGDLPGVSAILPTATSRIHLQRLNAGTEPPVEVWFTVTDWHAAFWFSVAALLEEFGRQLRHCSKCGALFVKVRRQAYCSPACSGAARAQRWYREHRRQALRRARRARKATTRKAHSR